MRSKASLIFSSGMTCVISSSMLIFLSMYQSTILGTSVRPRAPPNAVPFHTLPVTSWNGRVLISCPAPATPMMTDTLEAVVGAAVGQTHQVLHQIPADFLGVHEVRHPEAFRKRLAARIDIHADDLVRAGQARALDDVQPNTAQAKHHHVRAGLDLGGIDDRPDAGRDAAADVTDLLEGRVLADFGERNLRQHRVIGESRASHVVMDHLLAHREAAGAVRHDALALGGADGGAQVGLARQARLALPALGRVERNHVITLAERADAGPHVHDDARALVPENHRKQTLRIGAGTGEFVRVAHAARADLHQHFAGLRAVQIHGHHFQRPSGGVRNGSLGFHASSPLLVCKRGEVSLRAWTTMRDNEILSETSARGYRWQTPCSARSSAGKFPVTRSTRMTKCWRCSTSIP